LAGASTGQQQIEILSEVDVLVVGEVRERETTDLYEMRIGSAIRKGIDCIRPCSE